VTPSESLAAYANVPLEVEVVLDRTALHIAEILGWRKGSLIRLNRSAGENVDILVGGELLGHGEIIVIENTINARITAFKELS
jgi:flagellar motor switch protein FliN/FliY